MRGRKALLGVGYYVLLLIIFTSFVSALGVVPSSKEILFTPNKQLVNKLKVLNNDGGPRDVVLYPEGELSQYITLADSMLSFKDGETEKITTYTINQPSSFAVEGEHEGKIIVRELPTAGNQVVASLSIASKITLVVPYSKKFAKMRLFVGDFDVNKRSNFVLELNNLGTEDITSAQARVKIIDLHSKQDVVTLISDESRVPKKQKKLFTIPWTANVPRGVYQVIASIVYDGKVVEDQKVLTIGSESISISDISVKTFKLGGIAKFDILLSNEWSSDIDDVYARIDITKQTDTFASSTTQTVVLPALGSVVVNAYWDTDKVVPGNYDLKVTLFYGDTAQEKTYPITVTQNSIDTGFTGQVIGKGPTSRSPSGTSGTGIIYLLVILVMVILALNIVIYVKFIKKR